MLIRPLLRQLDLRLAQARADAWVRREVGLGAIAEYQVPELLDRSRYLYGLYEYAYRSVFIGQIATGSIAIDIGANLGEYTLLAARTTGSTGRVLAVEPNPELCRRLERNLALSEITNVQILPCAVGSSEGEGRLVVPDSCHALGTLKRDAYRDLASTTHRVPIRRLDDLLAYEDVGRLDVVKLDVEGWELEVLRGASATLSGAKPVVLYECGADLFESSGSRLATPSMSFLENSRVPQLRHPHEQKREMGSRPRRGCAQPAYVQGTLVSPDGRCRPFRGSEVQPSGGAVAPSTMRHLRVAWSTAPTPIVAHPDPMRMQPDGGDIGRPEVGQATVRASPRWTPIERDFAPSQLPGTLIQAMT